MPTSAYKGTAAQLVRRKIEKSIDGTKVTIVYEGTKSGLEAIEPVLGSAPTGYTDVYVRSTEIETAKGGKVCTLTVEADNFITGWSGVTAPDDVLELQWQVIEKDIKKHPRYNAGAGFLDSTDWAEIAAWEADTNATTRETKYNALTDQAKHLALRLRRGQTSYQVFIPVASRTRMTGTSPVVGGCGRTDTPYAGIGAPAHSANSTEYKYVKVEDSKVRMSGRWQRREVWMGFEDVDEDIVNFT
jgi:hypothetical protein